MLKKIAVLFVCCVLVSCASFAARTGQEDKTSEYRPAGDWLQLPRGFKFWLVTTMATDKDDNLFIFHRGKQPIVVFDKAGKFLRSWGDGTVKTAHGLRLDHEGNVWTTDLGTHQVIKYNPNGKVLLTLGTRNKAGDTPDRFNKPADVAVSPAGDIYVADGYGNSRVVKFSRDGKFVKAWGKKGKGPGEFHLVHAIVLDGKGRVYVGDRENNRIQVFDADGRFLEQWRECGAPFGLFLQGEKRMLVADGRGNHVRILDMNGKLLSRFGPQGTEASQFLAPHGICADSQGAIYVAEGEDKSPRKLTH
jgi:DNA-binding beta-propeller fold protein YncE